MTIAIWGMGISGKSSLKYLLYKNIQDFVLINQGDPAVWSKELDFGGQDIPCYDENELPADLELTEIILAAGIDPRKEVFKRFKDIPKICNEELTFRDIDIPIIAVTGTNGKTTTVTLIAKALENAGHKTFLGGNIGTPFSEVVFTDSPYEYAVLELSSFQLELMSKFRANIAVILNITKSHMERYDDFQDYIAAKLNIVNNQKADDLFISTGEFISTQTPASKKGIGELSGFSFSNPHLVGDHHKRNFKVVYDVLDFFQIESRDKVIQDLINEFNGVKYRLEYLGEKNGISFYNDAKSTNTDATVNAVRAFKDDISLVLGGKLRDKTQDLIGPLSREPHIAQVFAIGEASEYIRENLAEKFHVICFESLKDLFENLDTVKTTRLVYSPAFPSFDQYRNYVERGKDFENLFNLSHS